MYNHIMKKSTAITLIIILTLILAAAAAGLVFWSRITSPAKVFDDMPAPSPSPVTTPDAEPSPTDELPKLTPAPTPVPTPSPTPSPLPEYVLEGMADNDFMEGRVNILVLGVDNSPEREASGSFRTDTMILVTVDFKSMDVDMISIPRDSYVKLYNNENLLLDPIDPFNKINAAFSLGGGLKNGGYDSAKNTVAAALCVPVNYFAAVDMTAVKEIVDAMGGIDYEVDIEVTMNGRKLYPGLQHLDGQAVLDYCRQRKGSSDVARADRQQRMLKAIFNELKTSGQIANLPKLYRAVEDSITTDLSFEQICSLALIALRMDMDQLDRHIVEGSYASVYKRDCWLIDNEALTKLVYDVFGAVVSLDPDMDGEQLLLNVEANRQAVAVPLYNATLIYDETTAFLKEYRSSITSATRDALSKNKSLLATYIRRECREYLEYYTGLTDTLLDTAYAEAGVPRPPVEFMEETLIPGTGSFFGGGIVIDTDHIDEQEWSDSETAGESDEGLFSIG